MNDELGDNSAKDAIKKEVRRKGMLDLSEYGSIKLKELQEAHLLKYANDITNT